MIVCAESSHKYAYMIFSHFGTKLKLAIEITGKPDSPNTFYKADISQWGQAGWAPVININENNTTPQEFYQKLANIINNWTNTKNTRSFELRLRLCKPKCLHEVKLFSCEQA